MLRLLWWFIRVVVIGEKRKPVCIRCDDRRQADYCEHGLCAKCCEHIGSSREPDCLRRQIVESRRLLSG